MELRYRGLPKVELWEGGPEEFHPQVEGPEKLLVPAGESCQGSSIELATRASYQDAAGGLQLVFQRNPEWLALR